MFEKKYSAWSDSFSKHKWNLRHINLYYAKYRRKQYYFYVTSYVSNYS